MLTRFRSHFRHVVAYPALVLVAIATLVISVGVGTASGGNSTATITGSFSDSCRDFAAHSSKDISHVVIRYADGRTVKDESTTTPDFLIDGAAGDEIDSATVKSGQTTETFTCSRTNSPPTAVVEVLLAPDCVLAAEDVWQCPDSLTPRTIWVAASNVGILCKNFGQDGCDFTARVRGTSSSDPDNDITNWSITFSDGTSTIGGASGDWLTNPPTDVLSPSSGEGILTTLTVTDSAGQSDSASLGVGFVFND